MRNVGGFSGGEAQVGGPQLGQLAPGAEPGQGQLRILAGSDDQVHRRRQVLDHKGEGDVNRLGIDDVVVVKDQNEPVREAGDFIEQSSQNNVVRRWPRGLERAHHPFSDFRRNRLQGGDQVKQKARGIVIPVVERQPGGRSPAACDPFADHAWFCRSRPEQR